MVIYTQRPWLQHHTLRRPRERDGGQQPLQCTRCLVKVAKGAAPMGDALALRSCRLKPTKMVEDGHASSQDGVPSRKRSLSLKGNVKQGRARAELANRTEETGPDIEDCLVADFTKEEASNVAKCLLDWYSANKRVLPWRQTENGADEESRAYAVWISEVMLQQTRVSTVVGYFNRWMERWPTLHHLAQASQEEVNEVWAGLGYYRRARYLLEGAKQIVEQGGVFPQTLSDLRKVPGIGDYTAGAIASIAFNQAVPVVDANVIRVICRLKAICSNPKATATVKRLWELAGQLVDPKRPGDLNQALMELGATICTPTSPDCSSCPVSAHCKALAIVRRYDSKNDKAIQSLSTVHNAVEIVPVPSVTDFPMKMVKAAPREEFAAVCVVEMTPYYLTENLQEINSERNQFLLVKRPQEGLLAGLWEFPSALLSGPNVSLTKRKAAMDRYLKSSLRLEGSQRNYGKILRKTVGQYLHVFSHIRLHMHIEWMLVHMSGGLDVPLKIEGSDAAVLKWVDTKAIHSMGLTSGVRKVYTMTQEFKHTLVTGNSSKMTKKR